MATTSRINALTITSDAEGDLKTVTVFATTEEVVPQYLTGTANGEAPLDVAALVATIAAALETEFA